jgi:ATP synthase protein I
VSPANKDGESRAWSRAIRDMGPFLSIGATLAVTVLLGIGGGYWLDGKLGTTPAFVLVGSVVGLLAAGYHFYRLVMVRK